MLVQCWPTIYDDGPASNQHNFNASCLLGCVKPSKHNTFVQCWTNVEDDVEEVVPTLYKYYTNVLCLLGIAVVWYCLQLTAGRNYNPTPTQCLLNVGPASPMLTIIHSVLVSTSFCRYLHVGGIVRTRCSEPKLG